MASGEELLERFLALSLEEPITLEAFLERAEAGEFGPFRPEAASHLIDRIERMTIANVEAKAEEAAIPREEADEVALAQLARFARLRSRYGRPQEGGPAREKS